MIALNWISEDREWIQLSINYPFILIDVMNAVRERSEKIVLNVSIPQSLIISKEHRNDITALRDALNTIPQFKGISFQINADPDPISFDEWANSLAMELDLNEKLWGAKSLGLWVERQPNFLPTPDRIVVVNKESTSEIIDGVTFALSSNRTRVQSPKTLIVMGESDVWLGGLHIMSVGVGDNVGPIKFPARVTVNINFRSSAENLGKENVIAVIPQNTVVDVLDKVPENGYLYVEYEEQRGYVYEKYGDTRYVVYL